MPKIVDRNEKRGEILSAALLVFSRHGYQGTNLQRVASQAGMGKSSLYHYFDTREALFAALVEDLLQREVEVFDSVAHGKSSPEERLQLLLDALSQIFRDWAETGPLLIDCLREDRGRRALRKTLRQVRSALTQLVRQGQKAGVFRSGDAEALSVVLIGCLDGILLQEIIEPGSTRSPAVEKAMRTTLNRALQPEGRK